METVFMVTTTECGTENRPDMFFLLKDAEDFLAACLLRMGALKIKSHCESKDVDNLIFEQWKYEDSDGNEIVGTIQEFEVKFDAK